MKIYKYLLMLPLALMAVSCSDENKEMVEEETNAKSLKSTYLDPNNPYNYSLWTPGETITYYLTDENNYPCDPEWRDMLEECMDEVMTYANIKFKSVRSRDKAQLFVQFDYSCRGGGIYTLSKSGGIYTGDARSPIGKSIVLNYRKTNPGTPNFLILLSDANGFMNTTKREMRNAILHELGHVLGLDDERYNRNFNLNLKRDRVIADWVRDGISSEWANTCYERFYGSQRSNYYNCFLSKGFDKESVMMDSIPASWTYNGQGIGRNVTLSTGDKETLRKLYPFNLNKTVELFIGSDGYNDAIIGTWENFSDKSKIRSKVGYGYKTQMTSTYPLYKCVKKSDGKVTYALKKGNSYSNGVTSSSYTIDNNPIAFVYDYAGYGRNVLAVYTKGNRTAVSYHADSFLISKGYSEVACFGAVSSTPE